MKQIGKVTRTLGYGLFFVYLSCGQEITTATAGPSGAIANQKEKQSTVSISIYGIASEPIPISSPAVKQKRLAASSKTPDNQIKKKKSTVQSLSTAIPIGAAVNPYKGKARKSIPFSFQAAIEQKRLAPDTSSKKLDNQGVKNKAISVKDRPFAKIKSLVTKVDLSILRQGVCNTKLALDKATCYKKRSDYAYILKILENELDSRSVKRNDRKSGKSTRSRRQYATASSNF